MTTKLTAMEQRALDAARQGNTVDVGSKGTGGAPVVDFTEIPGGEPEAAMPVPLAPTEESPPTSEETQPAERPPQPVVANGEISDEDMKSFARAAVGPPKPEPEAKPAAEPEPKEETREVSDSGMGLEKCPKCGWQLELDTVPEPEDDDKQEFVRSVLGPRRFRKRYTYFDGKVQIAFRSALTADEEGITRLLNKEIEADKLHTREELRLRWEKLRLSYVLESVEIDGTPVKFEEIKQADVIDDCDEEFEQVLKHIKTRGKWPTSIQTMITYTLDVFDGLYTTLIARTYDPDFWKGLTDSKA